MTPDLIVPPLGIIAMVSPLLLVIWVMLEKQNPGCAVAKAFRFYFFFSLACGVFVFSYLALT